MVVPSNISGQDTCTSKKVAGIGVCVETITSYHLSNTFQKFQLQQFCFLFHTFCYFKVILKPYILSSFTCDRTTEGHTSFGRITEVKLLHFVDNLISNEDKYYCFAGSENYLEKTRDYEDTNNKTLAIITATINT